MKEEVSKKERRALWLALTIYFVAALSIVFLLRPSSLFGVLLTFTFSGVVAVVVVFRFTGVNVWRRFLT